MNKIESLESEIKTFQSEIYRLQKDHELLSLEPAQTIGGNTADELIENIEDAAKKASERQQRLAAIQATLPILGNQLQQKCAELQALKKQRHEQELRQQQSKIEPELLTISHEINELSEHLDGLCEKYRLKALEYNKITSELKRELSYPIVMDIANLPCITTLSGRGFNLKLAGRPLGSKVSFKQLPQPYRPQPSYSTPIKTRIEILKGSLNELNNFRKSIPNWDAERLAMTESQISETERQLQQLEQEAVA